MFRISRVAALLFFATGSLATPTTAASENLRLQERLFPRSSHPHELGAMNSKFVPNRADHGLFGSIQLDSLPSEPAPPFLFEIGSGGFGPGEFSGLIYYMAVDDCGQIYVTDDGNEKVLKFSEIGEFLLEWGTEGTGDGQFLLPFGIEVDQNRHVYVTDYELARVQKFDEFGTFISRWGEAGSDSGQFSYPYDLGVHPDNGNLYVVDAGNRRVQIFDLSGNYLSEFGEPADTTEQFGIIGGIGFSPEGHVYLTDQSKYRVQRFTADGVFELSWGSFGTQPGQFRAPSGVDTDLDGNVYVSDFLDHSVQKFDPLGNCLAEWGTTGEPLGLFNRVTDVEIDISRGQILCVDQGNRRVAKFGTANQGVLPFVLEWGSAGSGDGQFEGLSGIAVDGSARVYVLERFGAKRIQKFNADGSFVSSFATIADLPNNLAIDPTGTKLYVVDSTGDRVLRYSTDGTLELQWGSPGLFFFVQGIAVDANGSVYLTDTTVKRVQKYDMNGNLLTQWGSAGVFGEPVSVATDGSHDVYVADLQNKIKKFDSSGNIILEWGSFGSGPGQFNGSFGIDIDEFGNVYVTEIYGNRVQVFDDMGGYIGQWGCSGSGEGQFDEPLYAAVDSQGDLYILDTENSRVQRFGNGVVDVAQDGQTPRAFLLHPSIPNPTRGTSLIAFDLPKPSSVSLSIYDVRGRMVRSAYENSAFAAGSHRWVWDGRDASGSRVSAGIYFYSLVTEQGTEARKLVVVE